MATPDPRELQRLIKQLNEVEKKISDIKNKLKHYYLIVKLISYGTILKKLLVIL